MIAARQVHRLANALGARSVLLLVAAFSSAAWAQAGYLHESSGKVSVQRASAKAAVEKTGNMFESDTVFRTGADGKAILKFADGQIVTLGADSALRVGRYRFVAGQPRLDASSLDLMKGEMRFVAGLIGTANPEALRITALDSMVRIQKPGGADFNLAVSSGPREAGYAVVARGEISMQTPYGPTQEIANGQYLPWRPERTVPRPVPVAAAPAAVQAAAAGLWATVLPTDAPVAVAPAARLAAAAAVDPAPAAAGQAIAAAGAGPALAGYVASSKSVFIQNASGASVAAKVGDTFQAGTSLSTGADGNVVLKFADGQVVALGPGSTLSVAQYQFDPNNVKASRSALDLVKGAMRYTTGAIHAENHEGVSITANASVIKVLGTGAADFTLAADAKEQGIGAAAVTSGEIAVKAPSGLSGRIGAGEVASWDPGRSSLTPQLLAAAPAELKAAMAPLATLALPENSPVDVASAARATAAVAVASQAQAAAAADPLNPQLRAAAQAAAEQADAATQTASTAAQSVAATLFASVLVNLPSTAAGPAKAEVLAPFAVAQFPEATLPTIPTVTPGGAGGCTGSRC